MCFEAGTAMAIYQVEVVAKLVDHGLLDDVVVLAVACVVPVVKENAEHGTSLPPVVWRIQHARIAADDMSAFAVNGRILVHERFGDFGRYSFDRGCALR